MANEYINKVVLSSGETLIDLTGDDVTAESVLKGKIFHLPSGASSTGTCTYDANTADATATAAEILSGKTAYKNGSKITGSMTNRGAVSLEITTKAQEVTVPNGFHDGSGKVKISAAEQTKLIAKNIREGITVLGVTGTMSGSEGVKAQAKTVTPTFAAQTITPDTGYTHLSQVTVSKIPVNYADNDFGGQTVTIG